MKNKNIRKIKSIKRFSILLTIAFILTIILNNFSPFSEGTKIKATTENNNEYEVLDDIVWSRTPDFHEDYGYAKKRVLTQEVTYNGREEAFSFSGKYWSSAYKNGVTEYTLNKNPYNEKGILQTTFLFAYAINDEKYKISLDYDTLTGILEPTQKKDVWDGKTDSYYATTRINEYKKILGINIHNKFPAEVNDFATWYYEPCNKVYDNYYSVDGIYREYAYDVKHGDQMRMFRGEFNLTEEELENYDYYITTGKNNPELILPLDDTLFVMVDEKATGINFTTSIPGKNTSLFIKNDGVEQKIKFNQLETYKSWGGGLQQTCFDSNHYKLSRYSDGWHAHLNDFVNEDGVTIANISSILKNKGAGKHKIELFCSDFNTSGGIEKLEIVKVRKPNVTVKKEAIKASDNTVVSYGTSNGDNVNGSVSVGDKINYRLSYTNNSVNSCKDITFNDENLGVSISKDGYYKNENKIKVPNTLKIMKGTIVKKGEEALKLLESLAPNETVYVMDETYLTSTATEDNVNSGLVNKVNANSTYFNEAEIGKKSAEVNINVKGNAKVEIKKYIKEIVRDNETIFEEDSKVSIDYLPRIYPGDKIIFGFNIENTSKITANNLNLSDVITNDENGTIIENGDNITFRTNDNKNFNGKNFTLPGGTSMSFESNEWTVTEDSRYILNNNIKVLDDNFNVLDEDNVRFIVYPRIFVEMCCDNDINKNFYVTVKGNDYFKTGMYLKDGDKVEIDNLKFNVEYKVSETIPMSFKLSGIDINGENMVKNNLSFNLMDIKNNSTIQLYNEKNHSKQFRDDDEVTNNLKFYN